MTVKRDIRKDSPEEKREINWRPIKESSERVRRLLIRKKSVIH
jgi:hypothetical protein